MRKQKYIIGIDEVGRGPLAGPVTVAGVVMPKNLESRIRNLELPLRDSKRLSIRQRGIWFKYIKNHPDIFYKISSVSPRVIDKINISKAANLAATRVVVKLTKSYKLKTKNCSVYLDGGLHLLNSKSYILNSRTVIKGDERIPAIMLASIVAKESRDKRMKEFHFEYPQYDFINNVGYGTKKHQRAIRKHGLSPLHRKSFKLK